MVPPSQTFKCLMDYILTLRARSSLCLQVIMKVWPEPKVIDGVAPGERMAAAGARVDLSVRPNSFASLIMLSRDPVIEILESTVEFGAANALSTAIADARLSWMRRTCSCSALVGSLEL